jgi:DNA-binding MarR family transcriptional regulator
VHKTSRRELHVIQRAFLCGALLGGASQKALARDHGISQATISRTFTRLKARAAELGIDDLNLTDPRLIKEAPKLFEDQNRRGRKELLTPEQRALVVAVATKNKEALRAKSSKFAGIRKLEDGTIERTMDPELVALGLPLMSTSTFEGCMYEAGYVRTKEGWKKVGANKSGKAGTSSGGAHMYEVEMADAQLQGELEEDSLHEDLIHGPEEPFANQDMHLGLQSGQDHENADPDILLSHGMRHDSQMQLDPSLQASQVHNHRPSRHRQQQHGVDLHADQSIRTIGATQQEEDHRQQEERLRQQLQMTANMPAAQAASAYADAEAWSAAPETANALQFGI